MKHSIHDTALPPSGYLPPDRLSGLPCDTPMLLGFSGGVDSSVLLHLVADFAKQNGAPLYLLHVHHGIRGDEADRDAEFAKKTAEAYELPLILKYTDVPMRAKQTGESLETAARNARYECFEEAMREHRIPILLTAHHADDNLETVLFHLLRGSGLSGLCGIPPVRSVSGGTVVRPLLRVSRAAIEDFASEHHIAFVQDSTNGDTAYTRNRLRGEVIPLLREIVPSPEAALSRMTASLWEDKRFLDALAKDAYDRAKSPQGLDRAVLQSTPTPVARRTLLLAWKEHVPTLDSYESVHLDALYRFLLDAKSGTHLSLPKTTVTAKADHLLIAAATGPHQKKAPPQPVVLKKGCTELPEYGVSIIFDTVRNGKILLSEKTSINTGENAKNIYNSATQIYIRFDTIDAWCPSQDIVLRTRTPGDRILSRGMHRSLRTLCNAAKLDERTRRELLVFTCSDELLWVPGLAVRDNIAIPPDAVQDDDLTILVLPSAHP